MDYKHLIEKAKEARELAYAPYSKFRVGAALLTKTGKIYSGCNIENIGFSPTVCAERTAIFKAVSEGVKEFEAIAIISDLETTVYPCGVCRQVMTEFFEPDTPIICADKEGEYKVHKFCEVMPFAFTELSSS
jgi:cytidine deaminase